jgi:hypothetical protein
MGLDEFLCHLYERRDRILTALQDPNLDPSQPPWPGTMMNAQVVNVVERLRREDEYAFSAAEWKHKDADLYLDLVNINAHLIVMLLNPIES